MLHSPSERTGQTLATRVGWTVAVMCLVLTGSGGSGVDARAHQQPAVPSEKEARTPAQAKINSQILYEIYRRRGEADSKGVPPDRPASMSTRAAAPSSTCGPT